MVRRRCAVREPAPEPRLRGEQVGDRVQLLGQSDQPVGREPTENGVGLLADLLECLTAR